MKSLTKATGRKQFLCLGEALSNVNMLHPGRTDRSETRPALCGEEICLFVEFITKLARKFYH